MLFVVFIVRFGHFGGGSVAIGAELALDAELHLKHLRFLLTANANAVDNLALLSFFLPLYSQLLPHLNSAR